MSKFLKLKRDRGLGLKPDTAIIENSSREVVFDMVSSMCDNKDLLLFKTDDKGNYYVSLLTVSGQLQALTNLQMKIDIFDLLWAADDGKWDDVVSMVETGTSMVSKIRAR